MTGVAHVRVVGLLLVVLVVAFGVVVGRRLTPGLAFLTLLVLAWAAFAVAGVDPALSGVVAGVLVPVTSPRARHLELRVLLSSVAVVLPLFAFVACGVAWRSLSLSGPSGTIILGTAVIRLAGKVLGISFGVALASRLGLRRHASISWPILIGASLLCAIGITVPLLFAGALYPTASATYGAFTVGLLVASLFGAAGGLAVLRRAVPPVLGARDAHT